MIQFAAAQVRTSGAARVLWDRVPTQRIRVSVVPFLLQRLRREDIIWSSIDLHTGSSVGRPFTSVRSAVAREAEARGGPSGERSEVANAGTGGAGGVVGVFVGLAVAGVGGYYLYETWGKGGKNTSALPGEQGPGRPGAWSTTIAPLPPPPAYNHLSSPLLPPAPSAGSFSHPAVQRVSARDELSERQRALKVELEALRKLKRDKFIDLKKKEIKAELKILSNSIAALDKQ